MDAEGVAAPPVPSDSSAGSVPAGIAVARASTAILAVLYLVVIALPVHWLVRALRACCEQRRQDRELVQELLPQASGSTNASPAASRPCLCSCEDAGKSWKTWFCVCFIIGRMTDFVLQFLDTFRLFDPDVLDLVQEVLVRLAPAFTCSSYVLVLGAWLGIYRTLAELRRTPSVALGAHASVPRMFRAPRRARCGAWLMPACFAVCAALVTATAVTVVVCCARLRTAHLPPRVVAADIVSVLGPLGLALYFALALAYAAYAVLLLLLFRCRFYNRASRTVVRHVVALALLLAVCFVARPTVIIAVNELHAQPAPLPIFFYYLLADLLPLALTVALYAKSIPTASSATARATRGMWTTV